MWSEMLELLDTMTTHVRAQADTPAWWEEWGHLVRRYGDLLVVARPPEALMPHATKAFTHPR